jgi:hypothetical protein
MRLPSASLAALAVLVACTAGCRSSTPYVPGRDAGAGATDTGPGPGGACGDDLGCVVSGADPTVGDTSDPSGRRCVAGDCGCLEDLDCRGLPGVRGPFCDPATLGCVECLVSGDCIVGGTGAVCVDGRCEGCRTSADCTAPDSPVCAAGACVGCAASSDCATSPAGGVCTDGACGCATSADCAGGRVCEGGLCAPPCAADDDCTDGYRPVCDTSRSECVVCLVDASCAGSAGAGGPGAHCVVASRTCGCADDSHCALSDDGRHCDAATAVCGCRDAADCPAERPICDRYCRAMPSES